MSPTSRVGEVAVEKKHGVFRTPAVIAAPPVDHPRSRRKGNSRRRRYDLGASIYARCMRAFRLNRHMLPRDAEVLPGVYTMRILVEDGRDLEKVESREREREKEEKRAHM